MSINGIGPNNCIEDLEPPVSNDAMFQAGQIPTLQGWFSQDKNYPLIPTDGQLSVGPYSHIFVKDVTTTIALVSDIAGATYIHGGGHGGGASATENLTTVSTPTRTLHKTAAAGDTDVTTTAPAATVVHQSALFRPGIVAPTVNPLPEVVGASGPQPPTISTVSPSTGTTLGGDTITISGTNLTGATAVNFGSFTGTIITNNATTITVTTPAEAAGNVSVSVTTPGGTATAGTQFTFQTPAPQPPTITSFSPSQGGTAGGTSVVIQGTNMSGTTSVLFGNVAATITANNSTSVTATAPSEGVGSVFIKVTAPGGTATSSTQFTYVSSLPTITGLSPNQGSTLGGTSVTITGTNLSGASSVTFGSTAATITANTSTSITATAPAETAGDVNINVTCTAGSVSSSGQFLYVAPSSAKPNILLVMMENNGQSTYYAGTADAFGTLMSDYIYTGYICLGHNSSSNYVDYFSGINAHDPYKPGTQTGSQTIYTGGTVNADYNTTILNDGVDSSTFNARNTIFDLLYAQGMTFYGYYDGTNTNTSPNYTPRGGYRDFLADFPRLTSAPTSLTYSTASNGNIVTGAGSLIELLTDPSVGLDAKNPNFAYVYPNNTNNGHNGLTAGATWLNSLVSAVQTTNWYQSGGIILVVTDEDEDYGSDSTTAPWIGLANGSPTTTVNGGAGGFAWAISISLQTATTGGTDLSSGFNVTSGSLTSAKTGNSTFEARTTTPGILATICSALGLSTSNLSTAATAVVVSGLLPNPTSGGPGGGTGQETLTTIETPTRSATTHRGTSETFTLTTVPSATKSSSSGGPPSLDSTSITVTDPAGNPISMTAVYTQTFPGTTAPWPTGDWFIGTPGGSNSAYSNWPTPTIATVSNGLTLPLKQGTGTQVESAGFGIYGTNVALPRCVDIIQKTNYGINGVVDYFLAWPASGAVGNASEDDYYEGNANGDLYMTYHYIAGKSTGQVGPYTIASDVAIPHSTVGGGLPPGAPGVGFNTNSGDWIYFRCFTNQNGMQLYAGANASSLVLISQISLTQIRNVLGGTYTLDTNNHWIGVASWCSQNVYSQITGSQSRQIAGIQIYS